jgi:hypothetical protein
MNVTNSRKLDLGFGAAAIIKHTIDIFDNGRYAPKPKSNLCEFVTLILYYKGVSPFHSASVSCPFVLSFFRDYTFSSLISASSHSFLALS